MTPVVGGRALVRIAVIWDGNSLTRWQADCLAALAAEPSVELVGLVAITSRLWYDVHARRGRQPFLWRAFDACYVSRRSAALARVDVPDGPCATVKRVDFRGLQEANERELMTQVFPGSELDVALDFSSGDVPDTIVHHARFGVWTLDSPFAEASNDRPILGLREFLTRSATTTLRLRCQGAPGTGVLRQATFRIRDHSYVRTLDDALFGAAPLIVGACRDALAGSVAQPEATPATGNADDGVPSNRMMARLFVVLGSNFTRTQLRSLLLTPQWNVGVVDAPIGRFLEPAFRPTVLWLPRLPASEFRADPFGHPDGSAPAFLVESYDQETRTGTITAVDAQGSRVGDGPVLRTGSHASYPYLVVHDADTYCLPQLDAGSGVRVFRAIRYPTEWEEIGVLVPGVVARDPTVFEHEGRWWLAFTDAGTGPMTHLHLWWADELFGSWQPHARNPVKIDVRSSRPAGTPFVHEGVLYRPAQDCSRSYGGAVAICRVDTLTPTDFREQVVRVVPPFPGPYARGSHTLAAVGDRTLVDGKRYVFTWAGSRHALASRLFRRRHASRVES